MSLLHMLHEEFVHFGGQILTAYICAKSHRILKNTIRSLFYVKEHFHSSVILCFIRRMWKPRGRVLGSPRHLVPSRKSQDLEQRHRGRTSSSLKSSRSQPLNKFLAPTPVQVTIKPRENPKSLDIETLFMFLLFFIFIIVTVETL